MFPLQGRRILVTRPARQANGLMALIAARGGESVCFPLIDIAPPADWDSTDAAGRRLEALSLVVFVSPNAVAYGLGRILARHTWPAQLIAAAVGPGTAKALAEAGVERIAVPQARYDSEALLALDDLSTERVQGREVLILRGDGGRELLAETLRERGATVTCVTCYRRLVPQNGASVQSLLRDEALDAVTLSSSEGLRNFMDLLDIDGQARLFKLPAFVPHRRIAEEAARLGLSRVVLTEPADDGLVAGLCTYPWTDHD